MYAYEGAREIPRHVMSLEELVEHLAAKAHTERKAMVTAARRSISQRLRHALARLERFFNGR